MIWVQIKDILENRKEKAQSEERELQRQLDALMEKIVAAFRSMR